MENKEVILKKIPLKLFVDILTDAWERGADYVDIIGIADEVQDNIAIAVKEEYMNTGDDDRYDVEIDEEDGDVTDEDLNQLI